MLGQVILSKYHISRLLDEGGMSKIYLARQQHPARDVVIKVLKDQLKSQPKTLEHFRREIHIISRFQHPNAVACYDAVTRGPHAPLLVMEFLRGVDLATMLDRETRFTPERVGRLLVQLCDVLQAAHDQGIVHRDLKPGNVMILYPGTPQETVKLMDFGLAKMTSMLYISPEELVDFNLPPASGTPEYISPEMVRGNDLDARGDLYSLGVMLFEMLCGRRPFVHNTIEGLMIAHREETPPTFADLGLAGLVSPELEGVVQSCLGKYPEDRPKSASELAQAYEKALGRRIVAARVGSSTSGVRPVPKLPSPAITRAVPPDRNAIRQSFEATMPEAMAMIKLKGFIFDLGGEVVESVPGMIRVRVAEQPVEKKTGLFGWMSGGGKTSAALQTVQYTDLELHMERRDPTQANRLTVTLVLRPGGGMMTVDWKNRCGQIGRDLQAYLMGR